MHWKYQIEEYSQTFIEASRNPSQIEEKEDDLTGASYLATQIPFFWMDILHSGHTQVRGSFSKGVPGGIFWVLSPFSGSYT